ncbi:MAG: phosphatidate cytidylyltransferase [Parachlamydiales bacterium]|jgi:phosphatidate cytidylyltransferase
MKKLEDLKNRFLISSGIIILLVSLIVFSDLMFMRYFIMLLMIALGYLVSWEFINLVKAKEIILHKTIFIGGVILEIISFFLFSQFEELRILPVLFFLIFMIYLFFVNFRQIENSILRISVSAFGFLYIAIPFGMLFPIIFLQDGQDGRLWVFYLIFVTKLTDIGGYFGGKLFGKRKLAEHISPNKTIFGSISGFVFAIAGSLFFLIFSKPNVFDLNFTQAILLGVILSGFSQFGDLCESLLKRDAKMKDSSTLPGIGGVLDMVDSLMFNIPIMYCYLLG